MVGNCLVAATKLIAGAWTGGAATLAEAIHSLVHTGNQALLLYGLRRATSAHAGATLGIGRELYFWSFIVALLIFSLGAGVAGALHQAADAEALSELRWRRFGGRAQPHGGAGDGAHQKTASPATRRPEAQRLRGSKD